MSKLTIWIDGTTKVSIIEKMPLIYNTDRIGFNSEIHSIRQIDIENRVIFLSNKTCWSIAEFQEAVEKKEIELICECRTLLVKYANFNLCCLACPLCKKS